MLISVGRLTRTHVSQRNTVLKRGLIPHFFFAKISRGRLSPQPRRPVKKQRQLHSLTALAACLSGTAKACARCGRAAQNVVSASSTASLVTIDTRASFPNSDFLSFPHHNSSTLATHQTPRITGGLRKCLDHHDGIVRLQSWMLMSRYKYTVVHTRLCPILALPCLPGKSEALQVNFTAVNRD